MSSDQNKISGALGWKLLERFGVQGTQFLLQIVLARILDPEHYGALSLMVIFTTLANVFIQQGFNTALIQNKDVTQEDYSSVFWVTAGIAAVLYAVLFFAAPLIAAVYKMPDIVVPFRVLALMLFPGALNSVQIAKVSRELAFKKIFYSNVAGIVIAGVTGIVIACLGGGVWALVAQTVLNVLIACLVMRFTVKLRIRFVCNLKRVGQLLRFGWKLLVSGLLNTLYTDLRSLVIGVKYDSGTLGYYNRGKQFPQFLITAIDGTVQSVMLPAMSAQQDKRDQVRSLMRSSVTLSSYLVFPLMAGLAGVAQPLIELLLTEKWLPSVPYMQIYCFTLAFHPVQSCNLQAINAIGRSDLFLRLEIIKKCLGLGLLTAAVLCFESPVAIAMTGAIISAVSCFINAQPNKKLIGYSYLEQMKDILPSLLLSLLMLAAVLAVQLLRLSAGVTLVLQVVVGVAVYAGLSAAVRLTPFMLLLDQLKAILKKRK